jgi:hypothetical protein
MYTRSTKPTHMTSAPLILAGASSAEKIGTVAFLAPIPIPMMNLAANSPCQDLAKADPIGEACGGKEDFTSTSEVLVERIDNESSTVRLDVGDEIYMQ